MCATDCMKGGGAERGREREGARGKEEERNSVLFKWESGALRGKETQTERRRQTKKWRQIYFTHGKKRETSKKKGKEGRGKDCLDFFSL